MSSIMNTVRILFSSNLYIYMLSLQWIIPRAFLLEKYFPYFYVVSMSLLRIDTALMGNMFNSLLLYESKCKIKEARILNNLLSGLV